MSEQMSNVKISRSEQTQKRIIYNFLDLINTKKWDKITVKEICQKTDITRGTFYQYFTNTEELMEELQNELLEDLTKRYRRLPNPLPAAYPIERFNEKFDYNAPERLYCWFAFCKRHKHKMQVLLNEKNGDIEFIKKLKDILNAEINIMMDADGMPYDEYRTQFIKVFLDLHFMTARNWLDSDSEYSLQTNEIIHILNTMRIGGNYLTYREHITPNFKAKAYFPEEE